MRPLLLLCLFVITANTYAQVAISSDNGLPHPSAMLDIRSYTKGVLVPRMTTYQRLAIKNPGTGLLVFDLDTNTFWFYNSLAWVELNMNGPWLSAANGIYYSKGKVGIGTLPHEFYPLYVRQANYNDGRSVAVFEADDYWHAAISIKNNTVNQQFAMVVGGINNQEVRPRNFGLLNTNLTRWSMVVDGTNNNVGFGAPDIHSPSPKSTIHVFTGDVNIEQIGSGIILKSPNGQRWRVTIDDEGNLVRAPVTNL